VKYLLRKNIGENGFREISEEYFRDLGHSFGCLLNGYHIEQKFDLVTENFIEFESDVFRTLLNHMVGRYPGWNTHLEVQLLVNRRLSNLLSSCRTYFDQIYRHITSCFCGNGERSKTLKDYASELYTQDLSYRFMEALRNHVQHHSLGVHRSVIGGRRLENTLGADIEYQIGFTVSKKELAKNKRFKASVLEEIGDSVDVVTSVREYIRCINLIQSKARQLIDPELEAANGFLSDAAGEIVDDNNYFGAVAVGCDDSGAETEIIPLSLTHWKEISKLRLKNKALSRFDSGSFSGTPLK